MTEKRVPMSTAPSSVLQVSPLEVSCPGHLSKFAVFLLNKDGLVLLFDLTGMHQSIYFNLVTDKVVHLPTFKFGNRIKDEVMLVHNRYLVAWETSTNGTLKCYDPRSCKWKTLQKPSLVHRKQGFTTLVTSRGIYMIGGCAQRGGLMQGAEFLWWESTDADPASWRTLPPIPAAVSNAAALELKDESLYVIGGSGQGALTWVFSNETWRKGPSLKTPRQDATALLVGEETIAVLGGTDPITGHSVTDVEVWNNTLGSDTFLVLEDQLSFQPFERNKIVCTGNDIFIFGELSSKVTKIHIPCDLLTKDRLMPTTPPAEKEVPNIVPQQQLIAPIGAPLPLETPLRPLLGSTVPVSVPHRAQELGAYITKLNEIQQEFNQVTLADATSRITEWYDTTRDSAIQETQRHAQVWNDETQKRLEEARQEQTRLESILQQDQALLSLESCNDDFDDGVPSQLRCPITLSLMKDPVVAADGNTYDRAALERWFARHSQSTTSPLTGAVLPSKLYFPVHTLKTLCQEHEYKMEQKAKDKKEHGNGT